ncbi:putrescine-binding periplasmic protein-like protein [Actinidia rufa]|uniref:Putrescine-binding periplasmic protein-like protein n=1 Tax=Actinidia rufa TaxID=165716 RepID=A0A7J0FAX0_9ERIC|nr:putrescine-binding periplasmic protein-like protein [Actinidia rufa]
MTQKLLSCIDERQRVAFILSGMPLPSVSIYDEFRFFEGPIQGQVAGIRVVEVDNFLDWHDLWRPELAGKNFYALMLRLLEERIAVQQKLAQLQKQVRLFDSVHYLKAFGVGDVWVAVGWSSDILPAAKRMSNVSVIVPKSGASLWADLWAIPATSQFSTNRIGGRVRGPSPLIHQWIEYCLQGARAIPFQQEVIPGASPSALENVPVEQLLTKGKLKLDTNLIAGVPPAEILAQCEFLEPLSDAALADYQWLIATSMKKPHRGLVHRVLSFILSLTQIGQSKDVTRAGIEGKQCLSNTPCGAGIQARGT